MSDPKPARSDFTLTWLHLADLHVGVDSGHDRTEMLAALADDVRRLPAGVPPIDQVIVSGDVAFSGGAHDAAEYQRADAFLRTLCKALGLGTDSVLMVPGNHDVDRTIAVGDDDVRRWVDELRTRGRPLDEAIAGDRDRLRLSVRMRRYLAFALASDRA